MLSKYQNVTDKMVKWTVGLLKNIYKELSEEFSEISNHYNEHAQKLVDTTVHASTIEKTLSAIDDDANDFLDMYPKRNLLNVKENLDDFANKLKVRLTKELDENKKIINRIRKKNVDFKKIVKEVLIEANLPVWAGNYIGSDSKITPDSFTGISTLDGYKSVTYDFGQQNKTSGTRTQGKIKNPTVR